MANVKWDNTTKELLTQMYNDGKTDKEIADYFCTTSSSISRQRSYLGLVSYKRNVTTYRRSNKQRVNKECESYVGHYKDSEGKNHFIELSNDEKEAKNIASNLLYKNIIKEITILKPFIKLQIKSIVEVKL